MKFKTKVLPVALTVSAMFGGLVFNEVQAVTITWNTDSSGSWITSANWSPGRQPIASDDVVIRRSGAGIAPTVTRGGGVASIRSLRLTDTLTITLNAPLTITGTGAGAGNLTMEFDGGSNGVLAGAGNVTVNGSMSWTAGTMTGAGSTIIGSSATATLNGATLNMDAGRTFRNQGTVNWAAGTIDLNATSTSGVGSIVNAGTFNSTGTNTLASPDRGSDSGINASFTNTGTFVKSGAATTTTSNVTFRNSGAVNVTSGALNLTKGIQGVAGVPGSVTIASGAALTLGTQSDASLLTVNGTLNLGGNINISSDYNNSTFGVGNSFKPRGTNVSGVGQLLSLASNPASSQVISGDIVGGTTPSDAVLSFGTVHVGDVITKNYQIGNAASSGPILRGAIQTSVNGGNINDSRLGGLGVTAGNWGPLVIGASTGALAVTFNATSAGGLTGQQVRILNNFENTNKQLLVIDGTANNYADAAFSQLGGDGTLTPSTPAPAPPSAGVTTYTLDFGSWAASASDGSLEADLSVLNNVGGPADFLMGYFANIVADSAFTLSGFSASESDPFFLEILVGEGDGYGPLVISLSTLICGSYFGSLDLVWKGYNDFGYQDPLWKTIRLEFKGQIVPEPGSLMLLLGGILMLAGMSVRPRLNLTKSSRAGPA